MNSLPAAELKRRGMAAIEEGLRRGPVHLLKRNRPSAVVLTEEDYQRLSPTKPQRAGMTAVEWLLKHAPRKGKSKARLTRALRAERQSWV